MGRQWTSEHVRADRKAGGGLFPLLRRRGRKPDRRGGRHSGRGHIPGRVDISGRPEEAGSRERVGAANSFPLSAVIVWTGAAEGRSISTIAAETAAAVLRSTLCKYVYFEALSTRETTAPLWPFPMIVSASQSPTRSFLSTSSGLSEMSTRPGMWPRPECLPPRQFGFLPRRRSSRNSLPPRNSHQ